MMSLCSVPLLAQENTRGAVGSVPKRFCPVSVDQSFERLQTSSTTSYVSWPEFQKTVKGKKKRRSISSSVHASFDVRNYERHETE